MRSVSGTKPTINADFEVVEGSSRPLQPQDFSRIQRLNKKTAAVLDQNVAMADSKQQKNFEKEKLV